MRSKTVWFSVSAMLISILACNVSGTAPGQAKPKTEITSPASDTEFKAGDTVTVASVSTDAKGVADVQLLADGVVVHTDSAPSPQKEFSLSQVWVATAGKHVISVRAYNTDGVAGDPASIDVMVPEVAPASTNTPSGPSYISVTSQPSATPTNTPKPPKNTPKPPPPAGPPPEDFSGHWYTNYGTLDIIQNGSDVSGTLYDAFAVQTAAFTGTVSGDVLSGSLPGSPDPTFELTLGTNKITFDGTRSGGGTRSGKLCGAKPGHHFPDGCSFSGQWTIIREPVGAGCDALTLVRIDESVSGRYCNTRTITGTISYSKGGETILEGTMANADASGTNEIRLYLMDLNGGQFQGHWESASYAFCGWRAGLSQPTYCLRP